MLMISNPSNEDMSLRLFSCNKFSLLCMGQVESFLTNKDLCYT